ncbi:hypothetical protein ILUMI_17730 [Ignelater luminosus]|uniref:Uncharacterized protein n=1 Tax=Ignelater luminosus TaxID=2038154 RepID=A0A8K0CJC5_IGNLU|nr:hypothetical protein ILUMI_17730 [Ignelater luminosus]
MYLSSTLNMAIMHRLYVEKCKQENEPLTYFVKKATYIVNHFELTRLEKTTRKLSEEKLNNINEQLPFVPLQHEWFCKKYLKTKEDDSDEPPKKKGKQKWLCHSSYVVLTLENF